MNPSEKWSYKLGQNQQKILLILASGVGLSLAMTPKRYFRVLKGAADEWKKISKRSLERAIQSLYKSKLVSGRENPDGSLTMVLTKKGRDQTATFDIENMMIKKPKHWDGKWRMVLFDIPEKNKKAREAFRETIKKLGFYEFQKSVFVHPYECQEELDFVIEFFGMRKYVRVAIVSSLDNEIHLENIFGVS